MTITRESVGCWVVKCNPATGTDYFGSLAAHSGSGASEGDLYADSWCLSPRSGRRTLVLPGDLVALWVTGPKNPGIYEFGWVSDNRVEKPTDVDAGRPKRTLHYQSIRLGKDDYIPRSVLQASPELAACEQLRAPMMSNPSYLTIEETKALARLLAARRPAGQLAAARWQTLLD